MKISLNWICDYIDLPPQDPHKLAETITLSVCEVEGVESTGQALKDVIVAEILEIQTHPNADKLTLVRVNLGNRVERVVCGAKNLKKGDKVPYAGIGTDFGFMKIKKAKIRGEESCGMLCAEDELGFSNDHEGLMILSQDADIGTPFDRMFPDQVDVIFEIDNKSITHRPDLWGHFGFARELACKFKLPLKDINRDISVLDGEGESIIQVEVLAGDKVPRFSGLSIKNLEVRPSPQWIQHRLFRVGNRPINNLVDVTNYVMLDYGQPMHAFDAAAVPGNKILVNLAVEGETLMTLYNKEAKLIPADMVLYDNLGPTALAGVIGGLRSGIQETTKSIYLEAANWDPVQIRMTSTRIGVRTDACQRYEKSLDPELTVLAILKSYEILQLSCKELKIQGPLCDIWRKKPHAKTIETSPDFINRLLGKKIEEREIEDILTCLGFEISKSKTQWTFQVPSWRATKDICIAEDLVEEVGRIFGYNNIEETVPLFPIEQPKFNRQRQFEKLCKKALTQLGFHEVYNYPLTCLQIEEILGAQKKKVMKLVNPVAEVQNQMRTSLLPHFWQTFHENQKITLNFQAYEIGRIYEKRNGEVQEKNQLILGISSSSFQLEDVFYELKSALVSLFSHLQIPNIQWKIENDSLEAYEHPHAVANVYSKKTSIGKIFALPPSYRDKLDLRGHVCFALFDFDQMFQIKKKEYKFRPISKFPPVHFDLSIMLPKNSYFQDVQKLIKGLDPKVTEVNFSDLYFPKEQANQKSMTVSIVFQSKNKTFEHGEVNQLQNRIIEGLASKGYQLR